MVRAVPHLGSGIVLGVVYTGVGDAAARHLRSRSRWPAGGTLFFVGPDNSVLFLAAAESAGEVPVSLVVESLVSQPPDQVPLGGV